MNKGALFSECRKYRYALWRIWDTDLPSVMVIGLNPSTADEDGNDPTINNLILMLTKSGYGGFAMMNLFAFISSNPDDLRSCPDPIKDNDRYLREYFERCDDVIFAWGNFKQADYRAKKVINMFKGALCFGRNANGSPMHPLSAAVWKKKIAKLQTY